MNQSNMLNEHLNVIYILNEFDLSNIKSKAKEISSAAASGNILKFNRIFNVLPDISFDQLKIIARKKFTTDYKKSEGYINTKLKKFPEKIRDTMILTRSSLLTIKSKSKDPDIQSKVDDQLKKLDAILKRVPGQLMKEGITILLLALIVQYLVGAVVFISPFLITLGITFIAASIIIYITGNIIKLFIEHKKEGKKVVS